MNARIGARLLLFASVLALLSDGRLLGQDASGADPVEVTVFDLSRGPRDFDGHLVRVRAILVFGWEGDNFMSDPNPQGTPSGRSAYLWFHCKPGREEHVYGPINPSARRHVNGWFTGYFHFVPKYTANGVFDPGPLQFEAIDVLIPEPQPKSLADIIREGDLEAIRELLRSRAQLNVWDEYRAFPLFEAINSDHTEIAERLLAAGADPKLAGQGGETALSVAAWKCNSKIAKELVDGGASVNAPDVNGETALILASHTCPDATMVQLLLDAGADPNAKTTMGTTALMAASTNPLVAEKLLRAGADPTFKSSYGNTAESESCGRGDRDHFRVCELVKEALRKK